MLLTNWRWMMGPLREEASGGADGGGSESGSVPPSAPTGDTSAPAPSEAPSSDRSDRYITEGYEAFGDLVERSPGAPLDWAKKPLATPPTPTVPLAAPQAPVPAPQPPQQAAPAVPPQPIAPTQPAVQQPAQVPAPGSQAPNGDYAAYQAKRNATIAELTRAYSQFTPEEEMQLMTDPKAVLPGLLARAQADSLEYTIRAVAAMIPQLTQATIQHNIQENTHLEEFWGQYPDLQAHPQGQQTVWEVGNAYLAANPQADVSTRKQMIGLLSRAKLGLPLQGQASPPVPAQAPVAAPPQPQLMPLLPPYTPAGVGGSAALSSSGPVSHLPYLEDILSLRRI